MQASQPPPRRATPDTWGPERDAASAQTWSSWKGSPSEPAPPPAQLGSAPPPRPGWGSPPIPARSGSRPRARP
eukprot:8259198-Alexandrium_andersonii.AAC.1